MLWEIEIRPAPGQPDVLAHRVESAARALGMAEPFGVRAAHGYLLEGSLGESHVQQAARELLVDPIVEVAQIGRVGDQRLATLDHADQRLIYVLPKPGVMDPAALSTQSALADLALTVDAVRTFKKYWLAGLSPERLATLVAKVLANDAVEQVIEGPLRLDRLQLGASYQFRRVEMPIRALDDAGLERLNRQAQLYLSTLEMRAIQAHFRDLGREPTDVELETIAQTWSEHCSHKTLKGRIRYQDDHGERIFDNLLKETIFAATVRVREELGDRDWCVSVFEDNAGVVRFDDDHDLAFKVETHNHPSALEPYGGANTGLGGVIRDCLGTGLGAKPVCNIDVFCFAPPCTPVDQVPGGALHPRRVIEGVVAGVRDYGNRMGIPTVGGAIYFDRRYLGNPLVYCGTIGLLPRDKILKRPMPGDYIVAVGGRTGRDGIHGATFSSAELTHESESISGGAVQIGNAITEKMLADVLLQARDRALYNAITDCGAGGFSSAVGEMGADLGAEVQLEHVPLKYAGLSYAEIWISEAQERMVLAVSPDKWPELRSLCSSEGVEATRIGTFGAAGRLRLTYEGAEVADLSMEFLHHGRPPICREAVYCGAVSPPLPLTAGQKNDFTATLLAILSSPNVASKEWVIRQYDHEVQGGSVVKPLVGAANDGPSDAAVVRPILNSRRALVVACGMNPRYGDLDTYHMAASAIDEAIRNCVAVGADPTRLALLDNFCWGNTDRPETLGSLVRAAIACHDVAIAYGAPFISGKDSLNNEFAYRRADGSQEKLMIPPSLLISALGQIDDAARAVTMDLKEPYNLLYQVGLTRNELGGSHFALVRACEGGAVPRVDTALGKAVFAAVHRVIRRGLLRACHDLSEGGLAVAIAEMALAGRLGAWLSLDQVPHDLDETALTDAEWAAALLFSESNSRFLCEVRPDDAKAFEALLADVPHGMLGHVAATARLEIVGRSKPLGEFRGQTTAATAPLVAADVEELKQAWQQPLRFD
jgi:phosphoribosylformylglycinamidine synthase